MLYLLMTMEGTTQKTITRLLVELQSGHRDVADELYARLYEELHAAAHWHRRKWQGDYTLNTTALVHEAYLKLVDQTEADWKDRAHFLAVAAKAMRHILIDYARKRGAKKRGGDVQKVSLEEMQVALADKLTFSDERAETLLLLEEALQRLEQISERQSRIVECRFFGGLTIEETAAVLDISPATVVRGWNMARTWLYREMQQHLE